MITIKYNNNNSNTDNDMTNFPHGGKENGVRITMK